MTTTLTKPQRRGLEVLAAAYPATVYRTNFTDVLKRCLYWQIADWMVAAGYAEPADDGPTFYFRECRLTDMGIALCRELGIDVDPGTAVE